MMPGLTPSKWMLSALVALCVAGVMGALLGWVIAPWVIRWL